MTTQVRTNVARTGVFAAALVVVAVLATACSHSSSRGAPRAGGSSTSASAVAYSACMRSHGLANFPDPTGNGQLPKTDAQQLGVSTSQYETAQRRCQHLYPTSSLEQCSETGVCSPADRQELSNRMREFAQCMRSHGVPDFPDAVTGPGGGLYFNLLHLHSINARSQPFEHKSQECFPTLGGINIHVARP